MDEPTTSDEWEPIPVPDAMHSVFLEGPFRECVSCGTSFAEGEYPYQIQKTWRTGEVVFEIAVCLRCAAETMNEFSQESLEKMQEFFRERFKPTAETSHCHFCGAERKPDSEYALAAECHGDHLIRPIVVICGACNAASQENLSRKTRESMGDFIDQNLPGVPRELEPDFVPFTL